LGRNATEKKLNSMSLFPRYWQNEKEQYQQASASHSRSKT